MTFRTISTGLIVVALLGLTTITWSPQLLARSTDDDTVLDTYVGQIPGKCCKPGRRWGCDPKHFQQTGCVHIDKKFPACRSSPQVTMRCTWASCQSASTEDTCDITARTVGLNRCRPLGNKTTVGCPPDHWQCKIELSRYDDDDAPKRDVIVCKTNASTICQFSYNACD